MFRPLWSVSSPLPAILRRTISTKEYKAYRPLLMHEIQTIKMSWEYVQKNDKKFVNFLHDGLNKNYKMFENYFKHYITTEKTIKELDEFHEVPRRVYKSMGGIVSELEDENTSVKKILHVGEVHGQLGIKTKDFSFLVAQIHQAVECAIGPSYYTETMDKSWDKFLTNFNEVACTSILKTCKSSPHAIK